MAFDFGIKHKSELFIWGRRQQGYYASFQASCFPSAASCIQGQPSQPCYLPQAKLSKENHSYV